MLRQSGRRLIRSRLVLEGGKQRRRQTLPPLVASCRSRQLSSRYASSHEHEIPDDWRWLPSLCARLVTAFGITHIVAEYGVELTLCEGPSMLPTIRSKGEIILVDRLTPRINGIEGGCIGEERVRQARQRQEEFERVNEEFCWHEIRTPANQFPYSDKWTRLWQRLTSGISVGDVVVVQHPERHGTVCKRVLGLPGDVVIRPLPISSGQRRRQASRRVAAANQSNLYVIPDGHVWIEGDNSLNSSDSRNYGAVPAALIVGRVLCRVWPLRGHSLMERGARPIMPAGRPCSGSTVLPAGYEGEEILKVDSQEARQQ